jgi:hypothetical protein
MKKSTLNRMLKLADIKPVIKESKMSLSNFELVKNSADGNTYAIVRENKRYHIKQAQTKENLVESDFDYVGGVANKIKRSFTSFSEATKNLNLMFEEINNHYENESTNILESDSVLSEKKFVLKLDKKKKTKSAPPAEEPMEEPAAEEGGEDEFDFGGEEETEEGGDDFDFEGGEEEGGDDFDFEGGEEEGGEEFDFEDEEGGEEESDVEEFGGEEDEDLELDDSDDEIKDIQSTTGKLGQQLRDVEDISSDMQKWVAKSVLSALDLDTMDSEDKKDIIKTVKKKSDKPAEDEEVESSEEEFDFEEMEESYDNHMGDDYEDDMDGMDNYNWDGVNIEDEFPSYEDVYDETEETELVDEDEERYIKPRKRRNTTSALPGFHRPNLRNQEHDSDEYDSHMSEKSMEEIDEFLMDMEETGIIEPSNEYDDYDSYMDETTVVQGNSGEEEAGEEGNYDPNRAAYESEDKGEDTEIGGDEDDKVADPDDKNVEDKLLLDIEEDMGPEEMEALYGPNTKKYDRSGSSRAMRQADKDISTHYHRPAAPGYDLDPIEKWAKHKLPYDTEFMGEGDYMTEDHLNDKMETYEQEKAYEDVETVVRRYGMDVELREKATSEDPEESLIYLDIVDGDTKLLVARINSVGDIEVGEMRGNKFTGEPLDSVEDFIEIFGEDLTKKEKQKLDMEENIEMSPAPQKAPEEKPNEPATKPGTPDKTPGKDRPSRRPFTPPPTITPGEEPGPKAADGQDKVDKDTRYDKDNEKWSWEKDNEDVEFE